ncbi:Integral membrane protein OS=Tsukamurella paurometabola (strain ATCC 8368 / DSM / CCUG 35730/ CIP 100753 / JCM 10117 / KCTC 9821 / NBRC 16120 / NCIMB 702349/ NCTC 13040) OX=521096 GN=Tpau_0453 PE=4 SV=1 [Tsukamurella paurometabola]|uniref:Integral membrane protein n=1 Tax=Tsukamurella paurometabola (strain ATCC 8368 / DSM 20162 / CCUG 35730 / CIP 100753 / JCM 10117 / KCTC 9821 / NBRC 16120 / NCIMB 702349 / NCTC 13040) TaxID=521096 RepID=D5US27_TSUPD|nr:hypothetical protein [Tsukamurella paurometabola]ADG77094.1 conserved hypothetical protein [Tsukamurella paurometabola DSM 20162]SUP42754.1 Uncharacterised protein [Tsukamurella paurometabola]
MTGDEAEALRRRIDEQAVPLELIPIAPLGFRDLVVGAARALRTNPRIMFGLTAVVVGVMGLVALIAQLSLVPGARATGVARADEDARQVLAALGVGSGVQVANSALSMVGTLLVTGMVTVVVARSVLRHRTRTAMAWSVAGRRLPALALLGVIEIGMILAPLTAAVAAAILVAIAVGPSGVAGYVMLIGLLTVVAVFAMWPLFAMAAPAVVLERCGPVAALSRAVDLIRPGYLRLLWRLLLVSATSYAVGLLIWIPFILLGRALSHADRGLVPSLFLVVGAAIGQTVTLPFLAAMNTLLYTDQRIRLEEVAAELQRVADEAPSPDVAMVWQVTRPGADVAPGTRSESQ